MVGPTKRKLVEDEGDSREAKQLKTSKDNKNDDIKKKPVESDDTKSKIKEEPEDNTEEKKDSTANKEG